MWNDADLDKAKVKQEEAVKANQKASIETNSESAKKDLSLQKATLSEARAKNEEFSSNIAILINELDITTQEVGSQFSEMQQESTSEKIIGFFSKQKSAEMRSSRINNADVNVKLQTILFASEKILTMLDGHKTILEENIETSSNNIEELRNEELIIINDIEKIREEILELDSPILDLEDEISLTDSQSERAELSQKLHAVQKQQEELKNKERELVSKSQSHHNFIKQGDIHLKAMKSQLTAQRVMMTKIRFDTNQRSILYSQYQNSIKVSEQQEVAHKINEVGVAVDQDTAEGMAVMGSAALNKLTSMQEGHAQISDDIKNVLEQQREANVKFNERFANVLNDHKKENL